MLTVKKLISANIFKVINEGKDLNREILNIYTCDLLSIAMSKMPEDAAWLTVMANVNTLAVSSLTDAACVILAEGCKLDDAALDKAKEQGITVLAFNGPVFDGALKVYKILNE